MTRSARLRTACALAMVAAVAVAGAGCGGGSEEGPERSDAPDYKRALAAAPAPLADLYTEANRLLPGGVEAFERRLDDLRGHPVVVNKWASWCGPCREEFPWFQRLAARLGTRTAFVGVNSNDSSAAARTFLKEFPVPYPSYTDPGQEIARSIRATAGFPGTAFYDSSGELVYTRQGQYPGQSALAADIRRYAR